MILSDHENHEIVGQALSRPTFRNRYRFWRYAEGFGPARAAFAAAIAMLRRGE